MSESLPDVRLIASELADAYQTGSLATLPSARDASFDLGAAYAVEAELTRRRRASGASTVGYKVGFANKAVWRALGLETVVWAHMYDDTVQHAHGDGAEISLGRMLAAKIEPEIVFKLKHPVPAGAASPEAVLEAVESIALGFEVIDCHFADWKFTPTDFVASYGLHAALIVGPPRKVDAESLPTLAAALATFKVSLSRDGALVAEGSGRNVLRSPALCLGEFAGAIARQSPADALRAGDLVSSGTLTDSQLCAPGETWTATVEGIDLAGVSVRLT